MRHLLAVHPGLVQREAKFGYQGTFLERTGPWRERGLIPVSEVGKLVGSDLESDPHGKIQTENEGTSDGSSDEDLERRSLYTFRLSSEIWPDPFAVSMAGRQSCTWLTLMTIEKEPTDDRRRELDRRLVRRSLEGDDASIGCLVARLSCVPRILSVMNQKMGSQLSDHDLADLSQDILIVVWGKLDTYEGRGKLESWVYRFCFLEYMNRVRRRERSSRLGGVTLEGIPELPAPGPGVEALDYEELEVGLDELGPPEAEVIRLKHFEELTFNDIGVTLEISPNSAKTYYYRGLAWLRRHLDRTVCGKGR